MAYRSSTQVKGGGSSFVVSVPAGAASGDIALLIVNNDNQSATHFTYPAGFTELGYVTQASPDGNRHGVAWKRLTGADSGSYTITSPTSDDYAVACLLFSGRHATNPPVIGGTTTNTSSNASPVSCGATGVTAVAGDDLVWIGSLDVTSAGIGSGAAPPSGYTERQEVLNGGSAAGWSDLEVATLDNASAGATGTVTGTWTLTSAAAGFNTWLVRIPAAAASSASLPILSRRSARPYRRSF